MHTGNHVPFQMNRTQVLQTHRKAVDTRALQKRAPSHPDVLNRRLCPSRPWHLRRPGREPGRPSAARPDPPPPPKPHSTERASPWGPAYGLWPRTSEPSSCWSPGWFAGPTGTRSRPGRCAESADTPGSAVARSLR